MTIIPAPTRRNVIKHRKALEDLAVEVADIYGDLNHPDGVLPFYALCDAVEEVFGLDQATDLAEVERLAQYLDQTLHG